MHKTHKYHVKISSDLCVNGAHHSVMLFPAFEYFNSTANSQVKYFYLYCLELSKGFC